MANLFDYMDWRGDLGMDIVPFNPVDGLILAWFTVLPLKNPLPDTLGEAAASMLDELDGDALKFAKELEQSARFRELGLLHFESLFSEEEQMQFAALTLTLGDGTALVSYRGTDSTLVGWKEDFNMAFTDEVPAQREAVRYLNEAAMRTELPIRVNGHSKGGNLAMYAASKCEASVKARILSVDNYDGPGLNASVLDTEGYEEVEPRIQTWLPESSIVGILLERSSRVHVVKADAVGPWQHIPYSWQTTATGFVLLDELGWESLYADRTIRAWLSSMTLEERRLFVDTLYEIVGSTQAHTFEEVVENWQSSGWAMLGAFHGLDMRTKGLLFLGLGRLIRSAVKNLSKGT